MFRSTATCRPVISGEAVMSLAVSEPYAGSDVANIRTTAVRQGDHYVVNGEKKWITGGCKADYFTVAVRTGKPGFNGVSLLLIEGNRKGVSTRRVKTQGKFFSPPPIFWKNEVFANEDSLIVCSFPVAW